ncbi:M16 family metallopeptidase [Donghicola sp. XS_ASV15]|uniref:M16 family metallopeptidase n=1 Tax=Donghicola sp. XS_ASV15 TaxID=3241295 RepID=UPI003516A1FD
MIRWIVALVLVLGLGSCKDDPVREVVLAQTPEGRSFYFMEARGKGVDQVAMTIAWPTDWVYDAGNNPAVPHIAAQTILSGGTEDLRPQDVMTFFNDHNAFGRLDATVDHVIGRLVFAPEDRPQVIAIANEMLVTPQLDPDWVTRMTEDFRARVEDSWTQSSTHMWVLARRAILGDVPIWRGIDLPDRSVIAQVTPADLKAWHATTIVGNNLTIVVTGALSAQDAGEAVDSLLAGLPDGPAVQKPTTEPDFEPITVLLHRPEAEKTLVAFTGELPSADRGHDFETHLALQLFARSGDGPLFEAVRTNLRASYGFGAWYANMNRAIRVLNIAGEVETAKLQETVDVVRETYSAYRTGPETQAFAGMRDDLAADVKENTQNPDVAADVILQLALDGLDPAQATPFEQQVKEMTPQALTDTLTTAFPAAQSLSVIAVSADADALPGACVITEIAQIERCK